MESEIKKIFQISGYLIRSFANGLDGMAKHIESLTRPPSEPPSASDPHTVNRSAGKSLPSAIPSPSRSGAPTTVQPKTGNPTKTDIIMEVIAGAEDGVDVDTIARKTGFDRSTIRSAAFRLRKQGAVKSQKQGVYKAV